MKYTRIGRALICLLLVCVLLVNVSPIRAEASVIGAIFTYQTLKVVGATLLGLGVGVGATVAAFDLVSNSAVSDLGLDESTDIVSFGNGQYGVASNIVERIRSWLNTSDVITMPLPYAYNKTVKYDTGNWGIGTFAYSMPAPCSTVCFTWKTSNYVGYSIFLLATENCQGKVTKTYTNAAGSSTDTVFCTSQGNGFWYVRIGGTYTTGSSIDISKVVVDRYVQGGTYSSREAAENAFVGTAISDTPTTDLDLTLGQIGDAGATLADAYPNWAANAQAIDGTVYYPIALAPSVDYLKDVKQEDVWFGVVFEPVESSPEPSEPDTGEDKFYPMDPNYTSLVERLFGNVSDKIEYVAHSIQEIPDLIREFALDVKKGFEELPTKFAEWFNDIRTKLQQLVNGQITLADLLGGVYDAICYALEDVLTFLFAPRETFIQNQVETLIAKYPTSNNLFTLGTRLGDFLLNLGQTPPVIYIDLGAAEGSLLLGGTVAFLDLTWYARYKGTVDGILGAFLWLLFAWRVWLKLPGIIGGASGTIGSILSRKEDFNDN